MLPSFYELAGVALDVDIQLFNQAIPVLPDGTNRTEYENARNLILDFLSDKTNVGSSIFLFAVEEQREVEVEETVQVEKKRPKTLGLSVISESDGEEENEENEENTEEGEENAKKEEKVSVEVRLVKQLRSFHQIYVCAGAFPRGMEDPELLVLYVTRIASGSVSTLGLDGAIEYGVLPCDILLGMHELIQMVFVPSLEPQLRDRGQATHPRGNRSVSRSGLVKTASSASLGGMSTAGGTAMASTIHSQHGNEEEQAVSRSLQALKSEFRSSMQKFSTQLADTIQRVHGEVSLHIPDVEIDDPDAVAREGKRDILDKLETALEDWILTISSTLKTETSRTVDGKGPLAEIEFWRRRHAVLSTLYEQINLPIVQKQILVLERIGNNRMSIFRDNASLLQKHHLEAKDNVRFLSTLERHFKNVSTGELSVVRDTIPIMMKALRMVWIISRHFNNDDRMSALMARIANEIADKVSGEISIATIFKSPPEVVKRIIRQARSVLRTWRSSYLKVRKKIEETSDKRWEFEHKRLFATTDYMAGVCNDLLRVATVLDQFNKFLGPELKAVTGDAASVDQVKHRVRALIEPLEKVPFDIFQPMHQKMWEEVISNFREKVEEIEMETKSFIDTSFQKLRSAEGAFDLLQKFHSIESLQSTDGEGKSHGRRKDSSTSKVHVEDDVDDSDDEGGVLRTEGLKSIRAQMMEKFEDILSQYENELEQVEETFNNHKLNPLISKNQPPVAGAIIWARSLYHRVKKPIMRFRTMENLLSSEKGQHVKERYLNLAEAIDKYQTSKFAQWRDHVLNAAADLLGQSILGPPAQTVASKTGDTTTLQLPEPPYYVNFSPILFEIIRESRYLDQLGFEIPEIAVNITLQNDAYLDLVERLQMMLNEYHGVLNSLSRVERNFLSQHILHLRGSIKPGFDPLNWNSLNILRFIDQCSRDIGSFQAKVNQVHKSARMIEDVIEEIANTVLVQESDFPRTSVFEVSEFYEQMERNRSTRLEALKDKYKSISQLLEKIEEIVVETNTGCSPTLQEYYRYWERKIYNAIVRMIITSILTFQSLLNVPSGRKRSVIATSFSGTISGRSGKLKREEPRGPLCQVKATINPPQADIVVTPSLSDIYKFLSKAVKNIVESAKMFIRWMRHSCKECPAVSVRSNNEEEKLVYTFYQDVSQNPHVVKAMFTLNHSIERVFNIVKRYLDNWKRYDTVYGLWDQRKLSSLSKLPERKPSTVYFDSRLGMYTRLIELVSCQPTIKDIDFLRIDCYPVAVSVRERSSLWKVEIGAVLRSIALDRLNKIQENMEEITTDLSRETDDLSALKAVLHTIALIQEISMGMELDIMEVQEMYRTLHINHVPVESKESESASCLLEKWKELVIASKTRDLRLIRIKERFSDVTKSDVRSFQEAIDNAREEYMEVGPGATNLSLDRGADLVEEYQKKIAKFNQSREQLVLAEKLFNLPVTSYPKLQQMQADLDKLSAIYSVYRQHKDFEVSMSATLWAELDLVVLTRGLESTEKKLRQMPKELKQLPTFRNVETVVQQFRESLPLIEMLKTDALKTHHWEKLMTETKVRFEFNNNFTLGNLFTMELHKFPDIVNGIVNAAVQELKIETQIKQVEDAWAHHTFDLAKLKKGHGGSDDHGWVLRSADDIKLELEDHLLKLQTIAGSRFVGPHVDRVKQWERTLNLVNDCIDIWFQVQRKWMYLQSIFVGAEDIRLQLPEEAKKFDEIDRTFKGIMSATAKTPNVVQACQADNRMDNLQILSEKLDKVQKGLSDYLDTKRNAFPRFFFISDDELLSVLGSSDPTSIQIHLLKLFDNVKLFQFQRGNTQVGGQTSSEGESYVFRTPSLIEGPVETWMSAVENEMHASLHQITKEGVFHYAHTERDRWIEQNLGMVTLAGSQIWWTYEIEDVFRKVHQESDKFAMKRFLDKCNGQLSQLVGMVQSDISSTLRKKVNALIIIDVHARDIVDSFVRDSILDAREFAWESQLRFYWNRDIDDIVIAQCTGSFRYGYEYMGLNGRLVITPLTDRCYMTLTQALTFHLGGSPAGPAGTGKTETTKDLAKSLALPCFVTNCGEGLDYKAMGSIFSGLVQIGAWGCFDEFNRIDIEVLSVVSTQIRAIQNGLNYGKATVDIGLGQEIRIDPRVGIFITMNPGYAGRVELPDNLKALFRPVTMVVPDLEQICEIMLFSEGFVAARQLAKKMTVLYKLSKEQLSKQYHYDFGLRALKSVLVMAGSLKRSNADMSEELVLMRALRDMNMPKFVYDDVPLFRGLINDLFPGLDCPRVGYKVLNDAVAVDLDERGFRPSNSDTFESQIDKVVQLYETMLTRHTTMIVGPTGGGKTTVWECLQRASAPAFDLIIKSFIVNPKAQSVLELYGVMDPITRDWTDGILSKIFRECNQPLPVGKENEIRWIVFDGDVDAVWVENMNSVMDDNKLLTLPNGERIRLESYCKLLIEVFDLQYASPATISRCGMVYVDPRDLGCLPYYERWVRGRCQNATNPEELQDCLMELFNRFVPKCIDYLFEGLIGQEAVEKLKTVIPMTDLTMVKQLTSILDAILPPPTEDLGLNDLENLYTFSVLWSMGGQLLESSRVRFDEFLRDIAERSFPKGLLYDFVYDLEEHRWIPWETRVPDYKPPVPFEFHRVMVPTKDSVLYTYLIDRTVAVDKPLLFVGDSGTAKTVTIQNWLIARDPERFNVLNINFSSRTTSMDTQMSICENVDKRTGHIYGPPAGKKLVVFIDDMNMPKVDSYGTQQPIALLLFLVGRSCMFDRGKDLDLRVYKDMFYIGAMGPPGGGRNNVDPRFVALFNVFNLTSPTKQVLEHIYSSILAPHVANFSQDVAKLTPTITDATLRLFTKVLECLPPTPSKFHYIFNLRDLGRVYEGIMLSTTDKISNDTNFIRLWRNECMRIFCDRLISENDHLFVMDEIKKLVEELFPTKKDEILAEPLVFGDFANAVERYD